MTQRSDRGVAQVAYERALELHERGETDAAIDVLMQAIEEHPGDRDLMVGLGGMHFEQRRYDEAARWFGRVLKINPDCHTAVTCIFSSLMNLERYVQAYEFLLTRARLGPTEEVKSALRDLTDEPDAVQKFALAEEKANKIFEILAELRSIERSWQALRSDA